MIQAVPQGASHQEIKDAVLCNHSDLRTPSQRSNAYQNLYQNPDEVLQTYNTRYSAYFGLAYPELDLDDPMTKMHCTHYATSLYGKLGDEMTGRFNQELPQDLTEAFRKATNFEPRIITKQSIHDRKMHEVNHVDISNYSEDIEVNKHTSGTLTTKARIMIPTTSRIGINRMQTPTQVPQLQELQ